ncbi:MAG: S8 family serine peptidase [Melioribacteraceae bacterium]|nr:S8 family serine peptidase [Melioribacteraceae bacterium]
MMLKKLIMFLLLSSMVLIAQEDMQTFLSLKNTNVAKFLEKHPEYDGRGTIVYIFDTGVDQGIDGLKYLPDGKVKVVDVQDFTGQGDIEIFEADIDEIDYKDKEDVPCFVNEEKGYMVAGAKNLSLKSTNDEYFIGLLPEELWKNSGSGVHDLNGNGTEDDKFFFVTFETEQDGEKFWVLYLDNDFNGDLSDNEALRNYNEKQQTFVIPNEEKLPQLHLGLNIFPAEKRVNFHFDDGAHGTHCAGIVGAYKIGEGSLNGVAPGANIGSCKLGNNNFAGGATVSESMKKCFLYVDKVSKERKEPIIVNMSFGIGSEIEANSDIEKFIDDLVKKNPYIYLCTSNGNEGPGISTSGLPSASPYIFASGAVLAKEVAADDYGCALDNDVILYFSSRGGEVAKPDVISPGACTSTVPNFTGRDIFWGTSMASPYTAGVVSLLLSAAQAEFPETKIPSLFLYKAIRESATFWKQYDHVDQGAGYINVDAAWELLKKYIKAGELKNFETYTVTADSPNMPNGTASSLYIRNGSFIKDTDEFTFRIKRDNFIDKKKFYRTYKIVSDAEWLKPIQKNIYLRNDQSNSIAVKIDKSKLSCDGFNNAKIKVYRKGTNILEFEMMATVVMPAQFSNCNNYSAEWCEKTAPGMFKRHFINIPGGATSMKVTLASKKGLYANSRYMLHNADGIQFAGSGVLTDGNKIENYYYDLTPGVYELVTTGFFRAKDTSHYTLSVEFEGIERIGEGSLCPKNNSLVVINRFNQAKTFSLEGKIQGYKKNHVVELDGKDVYKLPFKFNKGESTKLFNVSLSKEDYSKTTDFAIDIYNSKGKSVRQGGLSSHETTISITANGNPDSTEYTLVLRPAFANAPSNMRIFIEEKTGFNNMEKFNVKGIGRRGTKFYPSIPVKLECEIKKPETAYPEGTNPYGKVYFKNSDGDTVYQLPIDFKF